MLELTSDGIFNWFSIKMFEEMVPVNIPSRRLHRKGAPQTLPKRIRGAASILEWIWNQFEKNMSCEFDDFCLLFCRFKRQRR